MSLKCSTICTYMKGINMNIKKQVISSIKLCMTHKSLIKDYTKIIRNNKSIQPVKINMMKKFRLSIQFQDHKKTSLVIPRKCGKYHIQIHVDKDYKLVKFMKIHINPRTKVRAHL